jgi:SAM-dependent methyltransferase
MRNPTMYGSDKTDLLVKYYDDAFGISGDAEVAWYLNKAETFGGPVLDLACGTGRLALMLAQHGFDVTGIDQSTGMLRQFESKLQAQPPEIRRRVDVFCQKMQAFTLDRAFNTIICCDAFFHNLTVADEVECLKCVSRHLAPEGRFVFNLRNPTCEFILDSADSAAKEFRERGRYPIRGTPDALLVEEAHSCDIREQIVRTKLRLTRYDADGHEVEKGESFWTTRYLWKYEAIHLLYRCGFEVELLVGDYVDGEVTEKGQLVFQAKLRDVMDDHSS